MRVSSVVAVALCCAACGLSPAAAFSTRASSTALESFAPLHHRTPAASVQRYRTFARGLGEEDGVDVDTDVLTGPRIDRDGRIINKKKKLYSYGALEHVDDFFVGKYYVEWTVRGVREKLRFRRRETGSPPLRTSRFRFAGIGGFILRLWLDGLPSSKPGHIALSFLQQEHWTTLDSPLSISVGKFTRGPFFFRSTPYFAALKSFCPLEEAIDNNTLRIRVGLASR
ncbi:hypothetical protein, conserved [Babesia bigemina]|uniref:Uncharacterized protein n=1 Tax=Babesia bigemina TaxID=5866 RepID=A0A061DB22_BABBI|nr:hypothetical protein, conserved [Babesia bigemina]CDR97871.1 hypothetical protein, conserved [Babesia bigemina]|eukprot:XP_012770057.1 hypothetical protein, conserved [Babesia bigemina]